MNSLLQVLSVLLYCCYNTIQSSTIQYNTVQYSRSFTAPTCSAEPCTRCRPSQTTRKSPAEGVAAPGQTGWDEEADQVVRLGGAGQFHAARLAGVPLGAARQTGEQDEAQLRRGDHTEVLQ